MDWDKLRIFHASAAAGSFTHAGDALNMSQSAVSRQVSALEKDLKVALFHLYRTVAEVMSKLQTAELLLSDTTTKPSGDLRVAAPVGLGSVWVTQRIREFMDLYPDIRVDLILDDEQIDIAMREADVAIWTREPDQPELIRRPLFTAKVRAMASTQYIRRFGLPETLADLETGHRIISYSGQPSQHLPAITWLETVGREGLEPRHAAFRVNSVVAIKHAIIAGVGIGMIPDYMTEQETDLVHVLTKVEFSKPSLPILFVYPEELKTSKKVQMLRDFLVSKARQLQY
jgi:DNA-binding transcriptional LysR family regulator